MGNHHLLLCLKRQVLGKIRERGLLLIFVVGGALVAFILTEFINSRSSGPREEGTVGSIYGEDIMPNEFSEALTLIKNTQQYQNYQEGQDRMLVKAAGGHNPLCCL